MHAKFMVKSPKYENKNYCFMNFNFDLRIVIVFDVRSKSTVDE